MKRTLRILLVQGHRNTSGGNPAEVAMTPTAARAIEHALRAAGHQVDMLQNDSDWFAGSLDAVAREVVRRHDLHPYDLMLDIHFEGDANGTRGVFAIVPDGDGLSSLTPHSGSDALATNSLDRQYAEAISSAVAESTGLHLRTTGVVSPGVMSERQTGVGGRGYRLAMFGYTARIRHKLVRLVLELGNIRSDAEIISTPGFFERAAAGVVSGIGHVLRDDNVIAIQKPELPDFGTISRLAKPVLVQVSVEALNARKWGELHQPIMRVLHRGNSFYARSWVIGERVDGNPIWWIMGRGANSDLNWRVWSGGTHFTIEQILNLPTQEVA